MDWPEAIRRAETMATTQMADDLQPVSAEWLTTTGWDLYHDKLHDRRWKLVVCVQPHGEGQGTTTHWLDIHEPIASADGAQVWWPVNFWQHHEHDGKPDGVGLLSWVDHTTRGHIRRLVAALRGN